MQEVELHAAWMFDCDNCGKENFVRAIVPETLDDDERAEVLDMMGIEDTDEYFPTLVPMEVVCKYCGTPFETNTDAIDGFCPDDFPSDD